MKKGLFLTLVVLAVGILIASMVTAQVRLPEPYAVEPLTGAAEVPGPGDADGAGTAAVTIDTETDEVCLTVSVLTDVATPLTGAHIHTGATGASGGVVVDFAVDAGDVVPFTLCVTDADGDTVAADPAGFYVNLHNAEFAAGAVRGQLIAPVVETPTATETTAVETATATEGTPVETATATPTTSVPLPGDLIVNGGFESELTGWTLKNAVGDKVKANKDGKVVAFEGTAAFKFKGGIAENTSLQQVPDLTSLVFGVGDTLDLSAYVSAKKDTAAGKFKVVVKYADETGDKTTAAIAQTVDGVYTLASGQVTLTQSTVSKIKLLIKHKSTSGKVYVDAVSLVLVDQPDPTATPEETAVSTATATVEATVVATETEVAPVDLVPLP